MPASGDPLTLADIQEMSGCPKSGCMASEDGARGCLCFEEWCALNPHVVTPQILAAAMAAVEKDLQDDT